MATVECTIVGYILVERDRDGAPLVDGTGWADRADAESERARCQAHADKRGSGLRYSVGAIVELPPQRPSQQSTEPGPRPAVITIEQLAVAAQNVRASYVDKFSDAEGQLVGAIEAIDELTALATAVRAKLQAAAGGS